MDDWKAELFKRLDAVAEKLGTTSAYLWHVLVRQGIAQGLADAIVGTICLVISLIGLRYVIKWWRWNVKEDWPDPGNGIGVFIATIACGILLICFVNYANAAILELANPEYYALHEVLQALGK